MKTAKFKLADLHKPAPAKRAPVKRKTAADLKPTTAWGREFLRRLDALHKVMDAEGVKKLA